MTPLLEVEDLKAWYGVTQALHGVSFTVMPGGITAVLGANGAGKTTTLRAISRVLKTTGSMSFDGSSTVKLSTEDVAKLGVAHAPEGRGTFGGLSVEENLRLGAWTRRSRADEGADMLRMYGYFPILEERRKSAAGMLSGGQQQMLTVARALMSRPRLLLLDEPSLGLAPIVTQEIFAILRQVNKESGVAILLVEQNAELALSLADNVFLLETGRVVMQGTASQFKQDDAIRKSYLGY
jgi:branched-chain amino acid transport system ATP-binding protein